MQTRAIVAAAVAALSVGLAAQENKPVPKDSVRVAIPGCSKGYIFTAGPRTVDEPGSSLEIRDGMHLRMNGPKKLIAEIKAHEGSMIEIIGLMKKGQYNDGVNLGGGVRMSPAPSGVGVSMGPTGAQILIDVEGWRPVEGSCRTQ